MDRILFLTLVCVCLMFQVSVHKVHAAPCTDALCVKFSGTGDCTVDSGAGTCVCTATDCGCAAGYVLETTSKVCTLKAPTVSQPTGRTLDVVSGQDAVMTCTAPADVPTADISAYAWKVDGTAVGGATAQTHTLTAVAADTAVICQLTHATAALNSAESPAVNLRVLAAGVTFAGPPVNDNNVQTNADGSFTGKCTDLPIGQAPEYTDENGAALSPLTLPNPRLSTNKYRCAIPTGTAYTVTNRESALIDYPAEGKYCTDTTPCSGAMYSTPAACTSNRCVCNTGYSVSFTDCRANGKECTTANQATTCTGAAFAGTCTNSRCDCAADYQLSADGCTGAAASLTASLLLTAMVAGIYRLFN